MLTWRSTPSIWENLAFAWVPYINLLVNYLFSQIVRWNTIYDYFSLSLSQRSHTRVLIGAVFLGNSAGTCWQECWRHWPQPVSSVPAAVKTISGWSLEQENKLVHFSPWGESLVCFTNKGNPANYYLWNVKSRNGFLLLLFIL